VAVLGAGNVGGALVSLLLNEADAIAARSGVRFELAGVAVGDVSRPRPGPAPICSPMTPRASSSDPGVDVVVELIGGLDPARDLVETALAAGRPVVTANKELIAAHGGALADAAVASGVDLLYEAAVAGAIPIIRPAAGVPGRRTHPRVVGIVNGTTNFILTTMSEQGLSYAEALAEAQRLGFAERDPAADVDGHDAAAKAAILASLAFRCVVAGTDVPREGIASVDPVDIAFADRLGYVVKLLAVAERFDDDGGADDAPEISVRVHPAMLPRTHPWPPCAGRSTPSSSRGPLPGSSCSTAVAPVDCPRRRPSSATSSTPPIILRAGAPARVVPRSRRGSVPPTICGAPGT
jgi:homoserine dehydrogenase